MRGDLIDRKFVLNNFITLTNGANRAVIVSSLKEEVHFIPNDLYGFISGNIDTDFSLVIAKYPDDYETILEYIDYLIDEKIIVIIESSIKVKPILNNKTYTNGINDAIIDFNQSIDYSRLIQSLDNLDTKALQVRIFGCEFNIKKLRRLLGQIMGSDIETIEIVLPYYQNCEIDLGVLLERYYKLFSIYVYNSPYEKHPSQKNEPQKYRYINFVKVNIVDSNCCGTINAGYFIYNIQTINENKLVNSCLNRKISIDIDGYIKNCPSMKDNFGNIKNTTIEEALNREGFKKHWEIKKDEIEVCKECEFRDICSDCRAYIEKPENIYSKPLKCGYSPYTNEWEVWSKNPLKQKAIQYYSFKNLAKEIEQND